VKEGGREERERTNLQKIGVAFPVWKFPVLLGEGRKKGFIMAFGFTFDLRPNMKVAVEISRSFF
jgi:hypothetical protein